MVKKILKAGVLSVLFLAFVLFLSGCGCKKKNVDEVTLTIWGVWDSSDAYDAFTKEYRNSHPNVKDIVYKKFPYEEYLGELLDALAAGKGPDIFMVNHTWVPVHKDKMTALNDVNDVLVEGGKDKLMTVRDFKETFVPVAGKDLLYTQRDGTEKIYAVPLWSDNLAVFYNRDLFKKAGITPPPKNWTWEDFVSFYTPKLTEIDEYNNIKKAGAALGYGKNVYRSSDIISALMLQMGSEMVDEEWGAVFNRKEKGTNASGQSVKFSPGERALSFYTRFADPTQDVYCWSPEMHYSIDEFYEGDAGMMLSYSHHISTIKTKAPKLDFGIAYMPQLKGSSKPVNYASYWAMAVSGQAEGQTAIDAWSFLKFITEKEQSAEYVESTGRVSPRLDLIEKQKEDPWLGVFAEQAVSSVSWRQFDDRKAAAILEQSINSVVEGAKTPAQAITTADQQISQQGRELSKSLRRVEKAEE